MKYLKPELLVLESAAVAITTSDGDKAGGMHQDSVNPPKFTENSAYEADE